jgi:hypothetical protein
LEEVDLMLAELSEADLEYEYYSGQQHLLVSELARYHAFWGEPGDAAAVLTEYGRHAEALPFYVAAEMWTEAEDAWNSLVTGDAEDDKYAWLTRKAIDLYSNGNTWFELASAARDTVDSMIAFDSYTGYMAQAIHALINGKDYEWPEPTFEFVVEKSNQLPEDFWLTKRGEAGGLSVFNVYPNPTNGVFTITSSEPGLVSISSIEGRQLAEYEVKKGQTMVTLPTSLSPGVYIGNFRTENNKSYILRLTYQP